MKDKELQQLVDLMYPLFLKKLKKENYFKINVKIKNATVVNGGDINEKITVKFPYDESKFSEFEVVNETGEKLQANDNVCLFYWIDLKNAFAFRKVK